VEIGLTIVGKSNLSFLSICFFRCGACFMVDFSFVLDEICKQPLGENGKKQVKYCKNTKRPAIVHFHKVTTTLNRHIFPILGWSHISSKGRPKKKNNPKWGSKKKTKDLGDQKKKPPKEKGGSKKNPPRILATKKKKNRIWVFFLVALKQGVRSFGFFF